MSSWIQFIGQGLGSLADFVIGFLDLMKGTLEGNPDPIQMLQLGMYLSLWLSLVWFVVKGLWLLCRPRRFPWEFKAKVAWICDGDSIWVKTAFRRYKLRLAGLDAPESEQTYGKQSAQALSDLIKGRKVTIRVVDRDIYGRLVSFIQSEDGVDVNVSMVALGAAWPYFAFLKRMPRGVADPFYKAYHESRNARVGLWQEARPQAPWTWRREHRSLWARFLLWLRRLFGWW